MVPIKEVSAANQSVKEVLEFYKVSSQKGLDQHQVESRKQLYGLNELKEKKKISPIKIFFSQFKSLIIYILLFAIFISVLVREYIDASVILGILILNAVLGFVQEYKAEKAIDALKKLSGLKARVLRNGKAEFIETRFLVPGDIILLEEGSKVPADARIIESQSLQSLEAALTGESNPVSKSSDILQGNLTIADKKNIVFSGTIITKGRAKACVVSIGMKTEIGKIADMITEVKKEETPLQKKLESLGKYLGVSTLIVSALILGVGVYKSNLLPLLFQGEILQFLISSKSWLITAVALAVAAVPEGLPAVVTITLAIGTKRMLKKSALIRKLPSVETLGDVTIICCDKTGTLTKNEMTVTKVFTNNKEISLDNDNYKEDELVFKIGVLCNNSEIQIENGKEKLIGDPTESALLVSARKVSLDINKLQSLPRIKENPFDSSRKMMSVVVKESNSKSVFYVKGAPEKVLENCTRISINGIIKKLDEKTLRSLLQKNDELAKQALRVLAFAYKPCTSNEESSEENDLIFVGLQGMIDPPSEEVPESIKKCKAAGIRIMMITGDNVNTAEAIAHEIGIEGKSINGKDFAALSDEQKLLTIKETSIFARVEPEHKMMIVTLLQSQGEIVAMTGDGVNDAPAIKKSDIGIAMGIRGTDVTKETSDMILLDDNFSTIVNTIEEGRGIRTNITKFVNYLISSNIAEILIILVAMLLNFPLPMTAIMLLWLNLVTDGLPALALGLDKNPSNIMQFPPTKKSQILNKKTTINMLTVSVLITSSVLAVFYIALQEYSNLPHADMLVKAQTIAFTTIVMMELVRLQAIRSQTKVGMFSNPYLIGAVAISLILQLAAIYTPLSNLFGTTALSPFDWQLILIATISVFIINLVINKAQK